MIFVFWLVMALVVAVAAGSKGYNGFLWFFYGLVIWPVALIHILVRPRADHAAAVTAPCPHCAERIQRAAKVCKHCGRDLGEGWSASTTAIAGRAA